MGYGAFPDELIKYMWRAKQPYNVSVASETAACAALTDTTYMRVSLPHKFQGHRLRHYYLATLELVASTAMHVLLYVCDRTRLADLYQASWDYL